MLDFVVRIKKTDRGKWPVPDKESQAAISRWAAGQPDGCVFIFRVLKKLNTRSKQQHGLYRLRNSILAPALDMDADSLHDYLKHELGMVEEITVAGKPYTRLRSQKEFSTEEMSALLLKQDELARFVNLDRSPEHYLILPVPEDMHAQE